MCLYSKERHLMCTPEDIIAYKVVYLCNDGQIISMWYSYKYTIGYLDIISTEDIYNNSFKDEIDGVYRYNTGFHSYFNKDKAISEVQSITTRELFSTIEVDKVVAEVIIPKGAFYVKSISGDEILSNQIKLVSLYRVKERSIFGKKLKPKLIKIKL